MNGDEQQQFDTDQVQAPDGSIIPVRHPKFERLPNGSYKPEDQRRLFAYAKKQYDLAHPKPATQPPPTMSASPDPIDLTAAAANADPEEFVKGAAGGLARGVANVPALFGEMGRAEIESAAAPFGGARDLPPSLTVEQIAQPLRTGISKVTRGYIPEERPETPSGQAGERVGEFLGDPASWIGPGGPIVKTIGAIAGGLGSYIGEQVGGTAGEVIGGAVGGGVTGLASPRGLPKRPPADVLKATTEEALKGSSKAAYKEMAQLEQALLPFQAREFHEEIKNYLLTGEDTQFRPRQAEGVFASLEELEKPYGKQPRDVISIMDVERVRQLLNNDRMKGGLEAVAAGKAIEMIDDRMLNLPKVAGISDRARGNWAAYKRGQIVEETIRRALDRASVTGTGANVINTIKQEFLRRIRNKPEVWRNFTPAEQGEILKIIDPGRTINLARYLSRFSVRHIVPAALAAGSLHVVGASLPQLLALSAAGEIAHQIGERATRGRSERLLELTRARSPAGGQYQPTMPPARPARALAGATRGLGASALSPEATEAIELPEITVTPQ